MTNENIIVMKVSKNGGSFFRELSNTFDRIDVTCDARKDAGRITRSSSNLENGLSAFEIQRLNHESYDIGLRYCLVGIDRKRRIVIGEFLQRLGKESVAGNCAHGFKYERRADPACNNLPLDHIAAQLSKASHMATHHKLQSDTITQAEPITI